MTTTALTRTNVLASGLDGPAHFLTWGPVEISVANLITIAIIIVLFILALVLPFPKSRGRR